MSPPSHLINLMLNVAARIAAGEWRGVVFGTDEHGEQIPVHWDWTDDEDIDSRSSGLGERHINDWPPRAARKMAGSFPESDDEDDQSVDESEGAVGDVESRDDGDEVLQLTQGVEAESDWSRTLGVD